MREPPDRQLLDAEWSEGGRTGGSLIGCLLVCAGVVVFWLLFYQGLRVMMGWS